MPGWTGFNTKTYEEIPNPLTISYLPVIDALVTDMSTIYTLLQHSVSICKRLQLPEIVLVLNEALYSKVQMIQRKHNELKETSCFSVNHTVMLFCTAISKIFKDAGLQESIFRTLFRK